MIQHEQSSPHQQGSFTPGVLVTALLVDEEEPEEVAEAVEEVVEGGIFRGCV